MHGSRMARARVGRMSAVLASAVLALGASGAVTAQQEEAPSVVVTTEILGALVSEVAADAATVTTLMPAGADPHRWEPSARDVEALMGADLLVINGLDLEEGLTAVIDAAREESVVVFEAAEHVDLLAFDSEEGAEHDDGAAHDDEHADHEHGSLDPHVWTDPLAMAQVVAALDPALEAVGIDTGDAGADVAADLAALDSEVRSTLAVVPDDARKLVTGHESLGYFAERYGFELVGTVIPGLTTDAEPSARELAELIDDIRLAGVTVVFSEVGTPSSVAEAVARDSGVRLVELSASQLPEDGSYAGFIRTLARTVAEALAD